MIMKIVFVPSDAVVIKNNINFKLFWFDYRGVSEIEHNDIDVVGVDEI